MISIVSLNYISTTSLLQILITSNQVLVIIITIFNCLYRNFLIIYITSFIANFNNLFSES